MRLYLLALYMFVGGLIEWASGSCHTGSGLILCMNADLHITLLQGAAGPNDYGIYSTASHVSRNWFELGRDTLPGCACLILAQVRP
jgi:hypothetical protein